MRAHTRSVASLVTADTDPLGPLASFGHLGHLPPLNLSDGRPWALGLLVPSATPREGRPTRTGRAIDQNSSEVRSSDRTPVRHRLSAVTHGYGTWVESVVREIAAGAGVPDFVFRAEVITKGGGQREVGDSLLWVGRQLVVVSVKSRDPDVGPEAPERRDRWLTKNITKAVSQINGTIRTLRAPPPGLALLSERGFRIPWKPDLVDEISGIVVVEHSILDGFLPDTSDASVPTRFCQWRTGLLSTSDSGAHRPSYICCGGPAPAFRLCPLGPNGT